MKLFSTIGRVLYRIWFYTLVLVTIIVMSPLLVVSVLKESWYPFFFKLARFWAWVVVLGMGYRIRIQSNHVIERGKSYMFIANHSSMLDIMMMLIATKNPFVFVGKKELSKLPIFGFFYKRTCIMVDRSDAQSKAAVFKSAQSRLNQGLSICIFPEGGVIDDGKVLSPFKSGAFRLAIDHQIPILPITLPDNQYRFPYPFLGGGSPGLLRATIHKEIPTKGLLLEDRNKLKKQSYVVLNDALIRYSSNK